MGSGHRRGHVMDVDMNLDMNMEFGHGTWIITLGIDLGQGTRTHI
jgi:hypothetical protein